MLLPVNLPLPCFLVFRFLLLVSLLLQPYHHPYFNQPVRVSSILHWHITVRVKYPSQAPLKLFKYPSQAYLKLLFLSWPCFISRSKP